MSTYRTFGFEPTLENLLAATAILVFVRQIFAYFSLVVRAQFSFRAVQRIAGRTFALIAATGLPYTERIRSGTIVNALFTEAKRAATLANAWQNIVAGAFKVMIYVAILAAVSWQAALIGLGLLTVVATVVSRGSVRGTKLTGRLINQANDRVTRYVTERFGLFRLMKMQRTEKVEAALFLDEVRELRNLNVEVVRHGAKIRALLEGTAVLGALLLIYLAVTVLGLKLAVLGLFLLAIFRLLPVVQEIAVARQQIAAQLHSVYYIDRITVDAIASTELSSGTDPFPTLDHEIRFDKVSFSYPASEDQGHAVPALHNIDLVIPVGKTTALLGPSGSGKSTLIDLIPRLRVPTSGRILFDDVPAEDIRLDDLRAAVAMVSQDALIIDGTIDENLRYGQSDASSEAVAAAAKAAHADEFIRALPNGYATVVGERGIFLSGGQKQRIALARALLAKVSLLLLDEPTSALDAESEQAVQRALETLQADDDVTIIIIAHRLSSVRHADQIVVLENGRVLGTGTHDALIQSASWYRNMVELQTGERFIVSELAQPAAT